MEQRHRFTTTSLQTRAEVQVNIERFSTNSDLPPPQLGKEKIVEHYLIVGLNVNPRLYLSFAPDPEPCIR